MSWVRTPSLALSISGGYMVDFLINMGIIVAFVIIFLIAVIWADGIDEMQNLHPDYKGEDFP
jgi:uncharacterized membrane protein